MGGRGLRCMLAGCGLWSALAAPLAAQQAPVSQEGPRRFELSVMVEWTGAWALRPASEALSGYSADIPRTRGPGIRMAAAIGSGFSAFARLDLALYGDMEGVEALVAGGAYRIRLFGPLSLAPSVGIGRMLHSGGGAFWSVVSGVELRGALSARWTFALGAERMDAVSEAANADSRSQVVGAPTRVSARIGWSFGERVRKSG